MSLPTALITCADDLRAGIAEMRTDGQFALDTEFVWDKTFYPEMGLFQFGGRTRPDAEGDNTLLVDPIPLLNSPPAEGWRDSAGVVPAEGTHADLLALVADLLRDRSLLKILHDSRQDLQHLAHCTGGLPLSVFDTRIAAGFCGLPSILSLQQLLRDILGIDLPKSETRTDWTHRPLTPAQIGYAREDVMHLVTVKERLVERSKELGTHDWLAEEMRSLDDPALYHERPADTAWERVKGSGRMKPEQLAVLREVAAERERIAIRVNRPRRWIVDDIVLLQLARAKTRDTLETELRPIKNRNIAAAFRDAAMRGLECPLERWPQSVDTRLSDSLQKRADTMLAHIKAQAEKAHIDPPLVGSRGSVEAWVANPSDPDHPLNKGWRREFCNF